MTSHTLGNAQINLALLSTYSYLCGEMDSLLLTGASGFLGKNILPGLRKEYSPVITLGLNEDDDVRVNLAESEPQLPHATDVVVHAAGIAHFVPRSDADVRKFFDVNHEGTVRLCRALEKVGVPRAFIFISTVAVYGCDEGELIDESHPLSGTTPYARSNIMAEQYLAEWCARHGVTLTILRPALMAGPNPPGNLGDMIRGIRKGFYFNISGGMARKSLLMAEDIARIVTLAKDKGGIYNVCDSTHPSYRELSGLIASQTGAREPRSIPYALARAMACVGDMVGNRFPVNSARLSKLIRSLTFSNRKAVMELGWHPMSVLESFRIE